MRINRVIKNVPHETQSMRRFGQSSNQAFGCDREYQVLVWNIYKGKKRNWQRDFNQLHPEYDILLLQEAKIDFNREQIDHFDPDYSWVFGESFSLQRCGSACGVLTGTRIHASHAFNKHGPVREPFINTPKSTAFTYYPIADHPHEILMINTHFINFRFAKSFKKHLDQIIGFIENHPGPVLFAGDFNTWNDNRKDTLFSELQQHGLQNVSMSNTRRNTLVLDHIFVKDLRVKKAEMLHHIRSSDHTPLTLSFQIGNF